MKKNIRIAVAFLCALVFVSCGKKLPAPDEFGFYNDMDAAVADAKKNHKRILLFITMGGFDQSSNDFTDSVLHAEDFKSVFGKDYVSVHFDFGTAAYEKTDVSRVSTEEGKKKIEAYNIQIAKNLTLARSLDMQFSPAIYLMNEDGYAFADEVYYNPDDGYNERPDVLPNMETFSSVEKLKSCIDEYDEDFEIMQNMVDATRTGSVVEKIDAITTLYETVDDKYIPTMTKIFEQVPVIDKNNESGKVSYLYYVYVISKTADWTMMNDYGSALNFMLDVVKKGYLEGEELQHAYFLISNMMLQIGSSDYNAVIGYLHKAVEADPESEMADTIYVIINQIEDIIKNQQNLSLSALEEN